MARRHSPSLTRSTLLHRVLSAPLIVCLLTSSAPAPAQSASTFDKRGQAAELREDYDAAYEAFRQAYLKKPGDLRYKARYERLRFQAGAAHVDRGRVLRQNGDLNGALNEFIRAHGIDASNETAEQEIRQIQQQLQNSPPPPASASPPGSATSVPQDAPGSPGSQVAPADAALAALGSVAGPVVLQPVSTDPITIHSVEDVKNIYTAIGKIAGINVLFDPDYTSRRIPVDLTNVSLSDSLRIVGTIAGTFFKPITPNTIFVAQNTRTKRTDLDELAVQTFYLTNAAQQNDANEIFTALRNLLDPSAKLALIPTQNAFVLRATPDQLLLAQKLLNDLDRAKPEVVVDVAVLEVNRDKIRNLGITLPQSFGLTPTATTSTTGSSTGTGTGTGTGTSTGTSTGTGTTSTNLTLNQLGSLNATNFAVSVTGGTVNALLTDADTRILQNPSIRATDGQRATLKIGSKIPVATGSYNAGVATGVGSIGVQTQFTYLDIGVNIDMTPTVHYNREVSLKTKIEVLTHNGDQNISGVVEPIISQRSSEQVIQLKEGEPTILAGIFSKQDTRGVNGTPGLGEIPFLKYFFSSQNKETAQDEIIFILIPHIVRESVLTRLNTRAIDTGTGQSIELRQDPNADFNVPVIPRPRPTNGSTTAAVAASSMIGQLSQQAQMPNQMPNQTSGQPVPSPTPALPNQAAPSPAAPSTAGPISLSIVPPTSNQTVGSTFQVAVMAAGARDLYSVPLQLQFNPAILQLVNVDSGDLLARDGQAVAIVHRDEGNGLVTISAARPPGAPGVAGQGAVCILTFKALAPGDSVLALPRVGAKNSAQTSIPAVGTPSVVHVK